MSLHRRPDGSQVNVGLLRHALLGGTSLVSTPAFSADFTVLTSLPSWLSFSRASNAMVTDSTGKLTYAPNNLLHYSSDLTNGAWETNNAVTATAGQSDPLGGTNACRLQGTSNSWYLGQTIAIPGNGLLAVWVKSNTGSNQNFRLFLNSFSAVSGDLTATTSWQQFSFAGLQAGTATVGLFREAAGTTADLLVYAATASAVTYETSPRSQDQVITTSSPYYGPRFDHAWNGSAWVATGLSIEEQRTNLFLQSTDLANAAWAKQQLNMSTDGTTAPDGSTATKFTAVANNQPHQFFNFNLLSVSGGSNYAEGIFAKAGSSSFVFVSVQDGGTGTSFITAVFDLSGTADTVATQVGTGNSAIHVSNKAKYVGNGWFYLSMVGSLIGTATTAYGIFGLAPAATGNTFDSFGEIVFNAAGTESAYFALPDLQAGSFITSTIPTTTAAVTRSADILQLTGAALAVFQGAAYSVVMKISDTQPLYYAAYLWSDGAAGVTREILGQRAGLTSQVLSGNGIFGDTELIADLGSGSTAGPLQIAFGIDASGRSLAANGGTIATDTFNPSHLVTAVYISSGGSGFSATMHCAGIAIYSSRLSDTDLQAKSVVGAA